MAYLDSFASKVDRAVDQISRLSSGIPVGHVDAIALLNKECGADMSFLPLVIHDLKVKLESVQGNMNAFTNLASCQQISPLVRRVTHGSLCKESVYGLVWIWSCSFVICVLSFVLLTTRAALYNSVRAKKKRPHKPKRVVEKEFEEYKEFMSPYYEDALEWKMLPPGKKKPVEIDFGSQIMMNPTFETMASSKDEYDNYSEGAEINRSDEESSYGSSYDSYESCDDSESSESDDDSQSAMTSFISETKSIAMQTFHTLRGMKPLLGNLLKSKREDEDSVEDDNLFLDESPNRTNASSRLDGVWNMVTPPSSGMPLFPGARVLRALTPSAPKKEFSFLSRTDAGEHELDPLTTPPSKDHSQSSNSEVNDLHPRQLRLSPFISPGKASSFTPAGQQPRFDSDDSDDDIYFDAPSRPRKPYRRYGRTRASRDRGRLYDC